jgi:hypothetical protein
MGREQNSKLRHFANPADAAEASIASRLLPAENGNLPHAIVPR